MKLGIETSSRVSSVALADGDRVVAARTDPRARGHVEFLMPAILELCAEAGIAVGDLERIDVGIGPGLFTSMRVGIATAKTIAQAAEIPIAPVCSLDALAYPLRDERALVCACVDARRGEVYAALYRGGERLSEPAVQAPEALARDLAARGEEVIVAGDAATAYAEAFAGVRADVRYPSAEGVLALARDPVPLEQVEPLYVRKSDAEIRWEGRGVVIERPFRVKVPKRVSG